jgi:hypothetical protein
MVRTAGGLSEEFEIRVGLHQGSALSPFLFVIIMDVLSEGTRKGLLWELLFADDLVIMEKTIEELQRNLIAWQSCLERIGLKMSEKKTEVEKRSVWWIERGRL